MSTATVASINVLQLNTSLPRAFGTFPRPAGRPEIRPFREPYVFPGLGQNLGLENDFEESYFHFRDFSEIAFKVREMYENPYISETFLPVWKRHGPRLTDSLYFLAIRQIPNPCSPKSFTGRFLHNPFPHCSLNTT